MSDEKSFHMTPDEFRRYGHAVVDWIADYQSRVESFPVLSQVKPGEIRASLPVTPPAQGEPFDALLKDIERLILPGVTHWQSPNFFAYFPCNASGPGILGDLLSSGLGRAGDAVVDQSGLHRTGNPCDGLAGRNARAAGEIPVLQHRRRRDSGHGFERRPLRTAGGPRTRHRTTRATRKDATASWSPTLRRRRIRRCKKRR